MGKYVNEVYFNEEERTDREMLEMYQSLKFDELFRKRANDRVLETLGKIRNRIEFITILLDNMNDIIPALDYSDENGQGSVEALKVITALYNDLLRQA